MTSFAIEWLDGEWWVNGQPSSSKMIKLFEEEEHAFNELNKFVNFHYNAATEQRCQRATEQRCHALTEQLKQERAMLREARTIINELKELNNNNSFSAFSP